MNITLTAILAATIKAVGSGDISENIAAAIFDFMTVCRGLRTLVDNKYSTDRLKDNNFIAINRIVDRRSTLTDKVCKLIKESKDFSALGLILSRGTRPAL